MSASREITLQNEIASLTAEVAKLRTALTKLETEIRNRGDAERMYIELIEAALANEQDTK